MTTTHRPQQLYLPMTDKLRLVKFNFAKLARLAEMSSVMKAIVIAVMSIDAL